MVNRRAGALPFALDVASCCCSCEPSARFAFTKLPRLPSTKHDSDSKNGVRRKVRSSESSQKQRQQHHQQAPLVPLEWRTHIINANLRVKDEMVAVRLCARSFVSQFVEAESGVRRHLVSSAAG